MRLTVTQANITAAHYKRTNATILYHADTDCPVAIALKLLGFHNIRVGCYSLSPSKRERIWHSKSLSQFIAAFDDDLRVRPHTFVIKGLKLPEAA